MTGLIAVCPVHGTFIDRSFFKTGPGVFASAIFSGCAVSCPQCQRPAPILDGVYEFIGSAMEVLHAPTVTRKKITEFRDLVKAAKDGSISAEIAEKKAETIDRGFADLIRRANQNAGAISVLLTIVAIFLQITSMWATSQSDAQDQKNADRAHNDAVQIHRAAEQSARLQQKIYDGLLAQSARTERAGSPKAVSKQASPAQTSQELEIVSRQQRRRIDQLERKRRPKG